MSNATGTYEPGVEMTLGEIQRAIKVAESMGVALYHGSFKRPCHPRFETQEIHTAMIEGWPIRCQCPNYATREVEPVLGYVESITRNGHDEAGVWKIPTHETVYVRGFREKDIREATAPFTATTSESMGLARCVHAIERLGQRMANLERLVKDRRDPASHY